MAAKQILFDVNAREKLLRGVNILANLEMPRASETLVSGLL